MYFFFPPDMKSSQSLFEPRVSAHQAPRSRSSSRSPIQKTTSGQTTSDMREKGDLERLKRSEINEAASL